MKKERLITFSDGVFAIALTLMVLEIRIPNGHDFKALYELSHVFFIYIISYLVIAIHWVNHHHLFQAVKQINIKIIWANFNVLFWLSLLPFATEWLGNSKFTEQAPVVIYALLMFILGMSYKLLVRNILKDEDKTFSLKKEFEEDKKGWLIIFFNLVAVIIAFFYPFIAFIILVIVKLSWFISDKRLLKRK